LCLDSEGCEGSNSSKDKDFSVRLTPNQYMNNSTNKESSECQVATDIEPMLAAEMIAPKAAKTLWGDSLII
jgi:hypothetical protein